MKMNTLFKFMLFVSFFTLTNQVEAQSWLKKLNKSIDNGLRAVDKGLNDVEKGLDAADKVLNTPSTQDSTQTVQDSTKATQVIHWDSIPVYSMTKVNEVDSLGQPVLNEDGTQKFRVFLQDQFGNIRSAEAVKAQQRKLWTAIGNITAKVGLGAIAGGALKGDLEGAAKGAAAGAVLSVTDIEMAILQKKSLNQQKKLLKEYQNKFNEEGYPKDAKVDLSKYKDFGLTDENTLTKSSEDIKNMCKSGEFNTTDDSAWDF